MKLNEISSDASVISITNPGYSRKKSELKSSSLFVRISSRNYHGLCEPYSSRTNGLYFQATGEIAFASLGKGFGYAARPMEERFLARLGDLPDNVHFLCGGKSWLSSHSGRVIEEALKETNKKCSVTVIEEATHHLMCTNPNEFNEAVNNILNFS